MDPSQASLFSPTGPVMARALCRQLEARIAKLEPYLSSQESYRLHTELSLVCVAIERMESRIIGLPEYRAAQLAGPVVTYSAPDQERLLSWCARRGRTFATRPNRERAIV